MKTKIILAVLLLAFSSGIMADKYLTVIHSGFFICIGNMFAFVTSYCSTGGCGRYMSG